MNNLMSYSFFPAFSIMAFVAVVLLIEGLYMMWNSYRGPEATKIEQRLRALSASSDSTERASVLKNRMLSGVPAIERSLLFIPRIHHLDRFILQSGLDWTVARLLSLSLLFGVVVYVMLSFARLLPFLQSGVALAAAFLPFAYVQWKRGRRLRVLEQQLPDALDLIGRALRAGHALPSGLKMVGEEMVDPIATEFRITHDEINFGISMQQALTNLSERVPITDLRYFVVAVLIQREAGGNLTEVLGNLSNLIRNRLKFYARVKVMTTEGRMSAWILGALPFALAALFNLVNHDFISKLWTDPIGIKITNVMLSIMAIGAFWLYKLIKIRV
ncbi:Flp pilus assembly protein TadB [Georgfuchsia toluolica]|uniref:Flp pilus assembly protein TadB n=1 Tax=Georgfuchsia toluolica TaxID=424218 RepID=A0A916J2Q3_9PROT|nr:type II secretion system F family protein [Georgfuchsia toluolica]CAG4882899.1 Flp pilus assembly protein TadB [Georgfuchsia toluolica]